MVARVSGDQKQLLERAAALQGRTLSEFLVSSAQDAARRVLRDAETMSLNAHDSMAFVAGLLKPPPITRRMRDTARLYRERMTPKRG